MNKPLELTWYEQDETGDYIHPDNYFINSIDVDDWTEYKRLTDAELAAEHWCEFSEALWWAPERGRIHTEQGKLHADAEARTVILERFATTPHYDEVTS